MMESIDRHQLDNILTYNCEGQWKVDNLGRLISMDIDDDLVPPPRPDLSISYKLESFDGTAPIPEDLSQSFRPDNVGQKDGLCFPFLFFPLSA